VSSALSMWSRAWYLTRMITGDRTRPLIYRASPGPPRSLPSLYPPDDQPGHELPL
jgi:hypothetical protein